MPWFFYNGRVPVPVKRVDGVVVSVPPRGHVEARADDVRKFGSSMRRCAPPQKEVERARLTPPTEIALPTKPSAFSEAISEKGVTRDPAVAPKRLTQPEERALATDEVAASDGAPRRKRTRTSAPVSEGE